MSRAEQPQAVLHPPAPRAGFLWTAGAALAFGLIVTGMVRLFQGGKPVADLTLTSVLVLLNPSQRVDLVYPTLITLIEEPATTKEAP